MEQSSLFLKRLDVDLLRYKLFLLLINRLSIVFNQVEL